MMHLAVLPWKLFHKEPTEEKINWLVRQAWRPAHQMQIAFWIGAHMCQKNAMLDNKQAIHPVPQNVLTMY